MKDLVEISITFLFFFLATQYVTPFFTGREPMPLWIGVIVVLFTSLMFHFGLKWSLKKWGKKQK